MPAVLTGHIVDRPAFDVRDRGGGVDGPLGRDERADRAEVVADDEVDAQFSADGRLPEVEWA